MTEEAHELPRGARLLDRYTILERVADGGMATIHTAVDERFDRVVCVKLLRLEIEGPGSTGGGDATGTPIYLSFLQEALALSKLQHPNTLRIYDFGYLDGGHRPFQVSEFLDGGNLRTHVRNRGALSIEETLAILERITGAIAEAHGRDILHRDIKPSNILFAHVGDVLMPKLADFGIARTFLSRRSLEAADLDASVGMYSPRWAAPEQLRGGTEGPYTDVYALGLVTTYMLCGVNPFDATHLHEALEERAQSDAVILKRMAPARLPSTVARVLMRAVTADPLARTQTPGAFFEDLRSSVGGARTSLPPRHPEPRPSARPPPESAPVVSSRSVARAEPVTVEAQTVGGRQVRVIEAFEKLDLDLVGEGGFEVRFRVSIVPERALSFRIQIKGLNCFISKVGATGSARPTPAISATEDGVVEFVSTARKVVGRISFVFGRPSDNGAGLVFPTALGNVVVASLEDSFALALDFGPDREIIVMCSKRG